VVLALQSALSVRGHRYVGIPSAILSGDFYLLFIKTRYMKTKEKKLSEEEKIRIEKRNKVLKQIGCKYRSGYTDEELEEERNSLCKSQGLSRFC
jgi:hypothetical protein